jgi:hypothetical protein
MLWADVDELFLYVFGAQSQDSVWTIIAVAFCMMCMAGGFFVYSSGPLVNM